MLPKDRSTGVIDRFAIVCQADERMTAAFLGGSYARGAADAYSDLDLGLITLDEAYDEFIVSIEIFLARLGEPLFLETFGLANILYFIFADGTEGELILGSESRFRHIHSGPYRVLVDKKGILANIVFPRDQAAEVEQVERLRRLVYWFWHDLSHFTTAIGRGHLWWGYGQLEALRGYCVSLARLHQDFSAPFDGDEPYYKLEQAIPIEQLAPLQATFCPFERDAMLESGRVIVLSYRELATKLAQVHGITYPIALEQVMIGRLEKLLDSK